jgi:AAA domain
MTVPAIKQRSRLSGEDDGVEPRFVPIGDFLKQCGQVVDYLPGVRPYVIKGGFVLVIGAPKSGKSFWVAWLSATVAAMGRAVLFVEEEGPREVTRDRVLPFLTPAADGTSPHRASQGLPLGRQAVG